MEGSTYDVAALLERGRGSGWISLSRAKRRRGHLALTFQRSKPASAGQPSSVQRATEKGEQRAADVLDLDPAWKLTSVDAVVDVGLERLEPSAQLVRQLGRQTEQGDHPRRRRRRDRTGGRAAGRHGLQSVRQRKSRKGREGRGRRRRAAGASRTSRRAKRSPADSVRHAGTLFRPFSLIDESTFLSSPSSLQRVALVPADAEHGHFSIPVLRLRTTLNQYHLARSLRFSTMGYERAERIIDVSRVRDIALETKGRCTLLTAIPAVRPKIVKTSWTLLNESGRTSNPPEGITRVWKRSSPEARTMDVDSRRAGLE